MSIKLICNSKANVILALYISQDVIFWTLLLGYLLNSLLKKVNIKKSETLNNS